VRPKAVKRPGVVDRCRAVRGLATGDDEKLKKALAPYLADRSPRVRATAIDVVRENELRELIKPVRALLRDKTVIVRDAAIECVGVLCEGERANAVWITPFLRDRSALVRVETLQSLGQIGDRSASRLVAKRLKDADPLVRAYAAVALADLEGSKSRKALKEAFDSETEERAIIGIADALLSLGDKRQFPVLLGMLKSSQYLSRCAAAHALDYASGLTIAELRTALHAVRWSARNPLFRGDQTTMESVKKSLTAKIAVAARAEESRSPTR
jgi:HEAT repeat protein